MRNKLIEQFKAARRVGTPIIGVATPDPAATVRSLQDSLAGVPLLQWDIIRGMRGLNDQGATALSQLIGDADPVAATGNPAEALSLSAKLPKKSVLFYFNAHRFIDNEAVSQAVWNLRDEFKANQRQLVLVYPAIRLPAELEQDLVMLEEELPAADDLQLIVQEQYEAANIGAPTEKVLAKAVDALRGLAAFPAEQVTAMSLSKQGVDLNSLWERKRKMIEQTPGLSVWRGGEKFTDIGGVGNVKQFLSRVLAGNAAPRCVVFIDEIEKALAGAAGQVADTSGVSQALLGTLLTYMQDKTVTGSIFIGPPGSAKSMVAKATGSEGDIPTIAFDLSGMKGSLVGESEANLRRALKVVSAVSDDSALFIATCNSIGVLPPELRRRFTFGTFFFDLPTEEERKVIWNLYLAKYDLPKSGRKVPVDTGWTGAEIRQCCDLAWRLRCSLEEAGSLIVPVSRSAADSIQKLRVQASGKFISASYPGVFKHDAEKQAAADAAPKRAFEDWSN